MKVGVSSDWAVFILVGAFVFFVIYAAIKSRLQEKKSKKEQDAGKDKTKHL